MTKPLPATSLPRTVAGLKRDIRKYDFKLVSHPNLDLLTSGFLQWRRVGLVRSDCFTLVTTLPDGKLAGSYIDFPKAKDYIAEGYPDQADGALGIMHIGPFVFEVRPAQLSA